MENNYISTIVVNYRKDEMTKECLNTFIENIDYPTEIVLYNNGTDYFDISEYELIEMREKNKYLINISIRNLEENLGFLGASNIGMKTTKGKYILLLNNDAFCYEPFLKNYVSIYKDKIGLVGPSKLSTMGITFLESSCLFFSREFFEKVLKELDQKNFGIGIFEDVLWAYKTNYCGFYNTWYEFNYKHIGSQTLNMDKKLTQTAKNKEIFCEMIFNPNSQLYTKLHNELKESVKKINE